jgi:hypothetical protein
VQSYAESVAARSLTAPIPVHVTYFTAVVNEAECSTA